MAKQIAVVGGGWAGCTAAVELTQAGHHVTLFEAARTLGGRARRISTDRRDLEGFRKVRNETLPKPYPPNTLVFVSGLASPDYLVEIEATGLMICDALRTGHKILICGNGGSAVPTRS